MITIGKITDRIGFNNNNELTYLGNIKNSGNTDFGIDKKEFVFFDTNNIYKIAVKNDYNNVDTTSESFINNARFYTCKADVSNLDGLCFRCFNGCQVCVGCTTCDSCHACYNCAKCNSCYSCNDCDGCYGCNNCNGCQSYCDDCTNCYNRCASCHDCDGCNSNCYSGDTQSCCDGNQGCCGQNNFMCSDCRLACWHNYDT